MSLASEGIPHWFSIRSIEYERSCLSAVSLTHRPSSDFSARLLSVLLKTQAWSTSRQVQETENEQSVLEKGINNVIAVEGEQGRSSSHTSNLALSSSDSVSSARSCTSLLAGRLICLREGHFRSLLENERLIIFSFFCTPRTYSRTTSRFCIPDQARPCYSFQTLMRHQYPCTGLHSKR